MTAVTIAVTQDDIDRGERTGCLTCPVALAIGRVFSSLRVHVGIRDMGIGGFLIPTPALAGAFIASFDAGVRVKPFEFKLDVPDELAALAVTL